MRLRNRDGDPVDPVPCFVVSGIAFAAAYSFGPMYVAALGLPTSAGVALSTVAFAAGTAGAYYRLIWDYRPRHREEIPVGARFRRLLLAGVAGVLLVALLSLPLVAG